MKTRLKLEKIINPISIITGTETIRRGLSDATFPDECLCEICFDILNAEGEISILMKKIRLS